MGVAQALDYMHNDLQMVHQDLGIRNIYINKKGKGKLGNFVYANYINQIDAKVVQNLWGKKKVDKYLPPETMLLKEVIRHLGNVPKEALKIDWKKIDIFQLGVSFFQAIFEQSPFHGQIPQLGDNYYRFLSEKKYAQFWAANPKVTEKMAELSKECNVSHLQGLIQKMLAPNPDERLSIEQVVMHSFFD